MKVSQGRIIIVKHPDCASNGNDGTAPAIINRVWDPDADTRNQKVCVNVTAFPDCKTPQCLTSVFLYDTHEEAVTSGSNSYAWWPERV